MAKKLFKAVLVQAVSGAAQMVPDGAILIVIVKKLSTLYLVMVLMSEDTFIRNSLLSVIKHTWPGFNTRM